MTGHGTDGAMTIPHAPGAGGMSAARIAVATWLSPAEVIRLLDDDRRRGIVVRVPGGWRLSEQAERTHGAALRALGDGPVRLRRLAGARRRRST
jgi:hypothetical protein